MIEEMVESGAQSLEGLHVCHVCICKSVALLESVLEEVAAVAAQRDRRQLIEF